MKNKKLLLLGGSRYLLPVIRAAHELGVYVITCDYLPDNAAHKHSDEYCNISIIDRDAVLAAAERLKIDGIMSFACDPGVVTAAYVAEKMGLPSCGPYESVCILQNKGLFRKFLAENGFNVPTAKSYKSAEDALNDAGLFHWPVIVKPTDSAGSKGVTKVDVPDKMSSAIRHALSYSLGGEFIVEDFICQEGFSSDCDSFAVDGEFKLITFNSQHFDPNAANPYTPAAYSWPSSMSAKSLKELSDELQRLIKLLEMKSSIYNIETREDRNGKPYIMECSPRGGGNRLAECLEYGMGVDLITNAVRAALGMPVIDISPVRAMDNFAEVILHSEIPGFFKELKIDKKLDGCVCERDLWIKPGTVVKGFSAANEAIGTVVLKFPSASMLCEVMADITRFIRVEVLPK